MKIKAKNKTILSKMALLVYEVPKKEILFIKGTPF